MNREDIIRMAREVGMAVCRDEWVFGEMLERFAALVAAAERERIIAANAPEIERCNAHIKALEDERAAMLQLFTDPENQPTQHGTVTVEYMQREIAAEREACAKACEDDAFVDQWKGLAEAAKRIRARKQA